jgi:IS605 OrfB family transposase
LRRRHQRANRVDKVKQTRGKETRWMRNRNHVISKRIVEITAQYDNPVIVFENLTGLRIRAKGSKRFNRMLSS